MSAAHLAAVKAVNWSMVYKQSGWRVLEKRRVYSNQAPKLFVCCVKAVRPTAAWWKSCESRQWGPRRAKMSEVFNATLMHGGGWKMTTRSTSKMLSPNLTLKTNVSKGPLVWHKYEGCQLGLSMMDWLSCFIQHLLVTIGKAVIVSSRLWK